MAGRRRPSSSPISIGNCKVEIEGNDFASELSRKSLLISMDNGAKIKISVDESRKYMTGKPKDKGGRSFLNEDYSFVLVNPKDIDSATESLLQEVLKIYREELPTMNYAANTGKESQFLQKCISSGKYKTLILKSKSIGKSEEVIAAMSYQIIPSDTQYAEIPVAAVGSNYQNKGIGRLIFEELKARLHNVGVLKILCWADKESEGFWLKQGFISIGEVDTKGKARRLPIKAEVRRALCIPGGSTLMVAHLKKDYVASVNFSSNISLESHAKSYSSVPTISDGHVATGRNDTSGLLSKHATRAICYRTKTTQSQHVLKDGCSKDTQNVSGDSPATITLPCCRSSPPCMSVHYKSTESEIDVLKNGFKINDRDLSSGQGVKRWVWEASLSSLKSKRIRGSHQSNTCQDLDQDLTSFHVKGVDCPFGGCILGNSGCKSLAEVPGYPIDVNPLGAHVEGKLAGHIFSKANCPRIMFMNIADDAKKTHLTKIVEELGGSVTCEGTGSTHVLTGKARRTMNFCIALCSGAWILSAHWLKESFREGRFLGESQFILEDEDYVSKYKSKLKDVVIRARSNPHSLLRGYNICISKHIQPSVDVLSAIIKSAGGNIIGRLDGIQDPPPRTTIFLACEEDMEIAVVATKKNIFTFSSDWFMTCVMKQELDLGAPQFAESL